MIGESCHSLVAKVRRTNLEACLTCPLCKQLFNEATSVDECMHTFCKKCIHDKIIEEDLDSCPVCNISLGCSPLDKLRPDHQWQNLRAALFPLNGKKSKEICQVTQQSKEVGKGGDGNKCKVKGKAKEIVEKEEDEEIPLFVVPFIDYEPEITKKKEKSLSSLVVDSEYSPKSSSQRTIITKRRSKLGNNKRSVQACRKRPISPTHLLDNIEDNPLQVLSDDKSAKKQPKEAQIEEATAETSKKMGNLCIKDSSKSKSINAISNDELEELVIPSSSDKPKRKYQRNPILDVALDNNKAIIRRGRNYRHGRQATYSCSNVVDNVIKVTTRRPHSAANPIWFCLVAAKNQKGDAPLSQIPHSYMRVKDANAPTSSIAKYIAMKLDLINESEVEIMVHGHPVLPSLAVLNLIDFWQERNAMSEKFEAAAGNSAEEVIMHLTYARKYYS